MRWDEIEGFYFDRIRINIFEEKRELKEILPLEDLQKESKSFQVKVFGHKTSLHITAPTEKFLKLLLEYSYHLTPYYFSYIEITHDTFCKTMMEAILAVEKLFSTLRKKYSFGTIFEDNREKTKTQIKKDWKRGLFHNRTFYSVIFGKKGGEVEDDLHPKISKTNRQPCFYKELKGISSYNKKKKTRKKLKKTLKGKYFKNVLYPRLSKINGQPCTHEEWRITGSHNIKNKTKIRTLEDLISFDFETFFKTQSKKFTVHEKLDHFKLGLWVKGLDGRRTFNQRQRMSIGLASQHIRNGCGIETYNDLVSAVKNLKRKISKTNGVRSEWQKRILGIKSLDRFKRAL